MPDQITENGPLLVDVCSVATPDKTYFVPDVFTEKTLHSSGAAYYYTADKNNGCRYWITDITLGTNSNRGHSIGEPPVFTGPKRVIITCRPHDLPSSRDHDPSMYSHFPVLKYDCGAHKLQVRLYKKAWGDAGFKYVDRGTWEGRWQNEKCEPYQIEGTLKISDTYKDPPVGIDVYRFAVIVIQRGSAQEAEVSISSPGPG